MNEEEGEGVRTVVANEFADLRLGFENVSNMPTARRH